MIISDLPEDLLEEIFFKVPAISLKRLQSTCKQWNTLLKTQEFTKKHVLKSPKHAHVLLLHDYKVWSISVNPNVAKSIEFKDALRINDSHSHSEGVEIVRVSHCDGLLLCTTTTNRPLIWNPCLGESRWIPLRTDYKGETIFSLGYQNNKSCRSYKILRCLNHSKLNNLVDGLEIYEFSSDSWRILDNVSFDCCIAASTGVSLKGNTYWLTLYDKDFLLSFDFTTERFKCLSLPPIAVTSEMVLSIVNEEHLLMLHLDDQRHHAFGSNVEIWVTNDIGTKVELQWTKSFILRLNWPTCMSYLILEENKVVMCCKLRKWKGFLNTIIMVTKPGEVDNYYIYKRYEEPIIWYRQLIFNYIPSLLQIQRENGNHC